MRKATKITKTAVDRLEVGGILYDAEVKGFVVRRLPSGTATYGYRFRNAAGESRWLGLGIHGSITAEQARILAKKRAGEVAHNRDPAAEQQEVRAKAIEAKAAEANSVNAVLDKFVKQYLTNLRSSDQFIYAFDAYVRPAIGDKSIYAVKRRDIADMLDDIAERGGPVMADRTLAHISKCFNWWAARDEDFANPIIRGMARTKATERARDRVLDDREIRDIWTALETAAVPECFARYVKFLLLTAVRRNEGADMSAAELDGDVWIIAAERYKNKRPHVVPLTRQARALIGSRPEGFKGGDWFVFSTSGGAKGFSAFSKAKRDLDTEIARIRKADGRGKMARWTLHDLRRTARTLMSRAGVDADHAERVLGHTIGGVRGTYDRFSYLDEKRIALEKLAALVDAILNPPSGNVLPFAAAK
jgi:integrase